MTTETVLLRGPRSQSATTGALGAEETATLAAIFERMFPEDDTGPGATRIGVVEYVERALAGAYADLVPTYRTLLAKMDEAARAAHGDRLTALPAELQDALVADLEHKRIPGLETVNGHAPFDVLWQHLREGLFCDPIHGGNRDMLGWRLLGFPGAQYGYTAAEQEIDSVITRAPRSVSDLHAAPRNGL